MMRTVVAIRHVAFEHLGTFAPVLTQSGHAIDYRDAGVSDLTAIDPLAPDLLVVLGAPIGVYQEASYPFLSHEMSILERRLAARRPTLGICLGAQLMARALGAAVYPGPAKELGWAELQLTAAGVASPLEALIDVAVLHWHGDTFDLPEGATLLASTPKCRNQAFSLGRYALGLQFHAEVDALEVERWLIGHACEIAAVPDTSVAAIRADSARFGSALRRQGQALLRAWLAQLG